MYVVWSGLGGLGLLIKTVQLVVLAVMSLVPKAVAMVEDRQDSLVLVLSFFS